jgi:hypothetical protein
MPLCGTQLGRGHRTTGMSSSGFTLSGSCATSHGPSDGPRSRLLLTNANSALPSAPEFQALVLGEVEKVFEIKCRERQFAD